MPLTGAPIPLQDAIARPRRLETPKNQKDPLEGLVTDPWVRYFTDLVQTVNNSPNRLIGPTELVTQGASIAATPLALPTVSIGYYRLTYYARITRAATTSSSLTVTLGWTDGGISCSYSGPAMTGNTTDTTQSGTITVRLDQSSPVTYATTYASVGGTSMQYSISVLIESLAI